MSPHVHFVRVHFSVRFAQAQSADSAGRNVILGFAAQSVDLGFVQQNPRIVQIHTLRLTYIYIYMYIVYFVRASPCTLSI